MESMFVAAEVVQILEGLHGKGVVHRDLKPENLMLDKDFHLKIIDFGTADVKLVPGVNDGLHSEYMKIRDKHAPKFHSESNPKEDEGLSDDAASVEQKSEQNFLSEYQSNLEHRKSFVGTVFYVAPEMLENQNVDEGCDLWALGIMIHRMLTGKYVFEEANDYLTFEAIKKGDFHLSKDMPEDVRDLIIKLLKKKPEERLGSGKPGSGNEMAKLKEHPFFKEINWDWLRESKSPLQTEGGDLDEELNEDSDSDFADDKLLYGEYSKTEGKLILSGLVKKKKVMFLYNTRQLLFYSNGRFEYFDPVKNIKKGSIVLQKNSTCELKNDRNFIVNTEKRVFKFTSIDIPAQVWIEKIKQTLQFM